MAQNLLSLVNDLSERETNNRVLVAPFLWYCLSRAPPPTQLLEPRRKWDPSETAFIIEYPVCRSSAELWTYSRCGSHVGRSDALVQLSSSSTATDFVWISPTRYDIFREYPAFTFPAYGHALWDASPGRPPRLVKVSDIGFIRWGKFYRLFNVLHSTDDPSHELGVPGIINHMSPIS